MIELGDRIKNLRNEMGISQLALGVRLSVSQEAISAYETNKNIPTIDVLLKMADLFGTSLDYLFGRDDVKKRMRISELDPFELSLITVFRNLSIRDKELTVKLLSVANDYIERRLK